MDSINKGIERSVHLCRARVAHSSSQLNITALLWMVPPVRAGWKDNILGLRESAGANIKTQPPSNEGSSSKAETWITATAHIMAPCAAGSSRKWKVQPVCFGGVICNTQTYCQNKSTKTFSHCFFLLLLLFQNHLLIICTIQELEQCNTPNCVAASSLVSVIWTERGSTWLNEADLQYLTMSRNTRTTRTVIIWGRSKGAGGRSRQDV